METHNPITIKSWKTQEKLPSPNSPGILWQSNIAKGNPPKTINVKINDLCFFSIAMFNDQRVHGCYVYHPQSLVNTADPYPHQPSHAIGHQHRELPRHRLGARSTSGNLYTLSDFVEPMISVLTKPVSFPSPSKSLHKPPPYPGILHVPWSKRPYTVPGVVIQPLLEIDFPFDHCYYHLFLSGIFCSIDINDIIINVYA